MKIAICDDCSNDVSVINNILKANELSLTSKIDTYTSSEKLLQSIKQNIKYDIAFLDVEMPGVTGLKLGKAIKEMCPNTYIVFVTSYPQYAIDAYECEAFHYLLKPVDCGKVDHIIERIVKKYKEYNRYYTIKIKSTLINLPLKDIYYIECCKKHIIFHLKDRDYETVGNLSAVYSELKYYGFYQIHQGYIVNMDKIKAFDKYSVILDNECNVMISVRKKSEVMLAYSKYIEVHI